MDALLEMSSEDLHALSVGTLKSVLYEVSNGRTAERCRRRHYMNGPVFVRY